MCVASKTHERPDYEPPRAFDGIIRWVISDLKLAPRKWRQPQQFEQPAGLRRILQYAKQSDNIIVAIVVDLRVAAGLAQQHAGAATKSLGIEPMRRQIRDDLARHQKLSAVPADGRPRDGIHAELPFRMTAIPRLRIRFALSAQRA